MAHVLKYTRSMTFHLEIARNIQENYLKLMNFPKNRPYNALDIGCGSGEMLLKVLYPQLPKNCSKFVAIDRDYDMIDYCKKLNVDPKFSFYQLDVETTKLPEYFKGKFDVIFSNYCLHFVRNMRQCLENCYKVLKPHGQFLFIFPYPGCIFYRVYCEMSKDMKWKPYMEDFADYRSFLSGNDPDSELTNTFKAAKLPIITYELRPAQFYEATSQQWLELFSSMDIIHRTIPKDKEEAYRKTFETLCIKDYGLPQDLRSNVRGRIRSSNVPLAIVYGRKEN